MEPLPITGSSMNHSRGLRVNLCATFLTHWPILRHSGSPTARFAHGNTNATPKVFEIRVFSENPLYAIFGDNDKKHLELIWGQRQ